MGYFESSAGCPELTFKCPVAFKVYDMDRDGFISNGELFLVLKMMVGSNLKVRSSPYGSSMIAPGLTIRLIGRAIATNRG